MSTFIRITVLVGAFAACAPTVAIPPAPAVPAVPAAASAQAARFPKELLWARTAAEHDALFIQTFRLAREKLAVQSRGKERGTWAVISDADETLLDNSEYQRRLIPSGGTYDSIAWRGWVKERVAPPLPGAVDYVNGVHALGGVVVVVSNREDTVCGATRDNLRSVALNVDLVLCRTTTADKNPRFEAVRAGTAASGLRPLGVLQWAGDNIQDFPGMTQRVRDGGAAAMALFGERYFVLPNPMYGSFERNRAR